MNRKSILSGTMSGILAGMALTWIVDYWGQEPSGNKNPVASSRSFGGLTGSRSSGLDFQKDKSLLSQTGTQLDTLLLYYSQMTSEELHDEIEKIDSEKKSNPTGSLSDAIAIMYLAHCWGRQDAEGAYQYSESEYLSSNMAMVATSWDNLVVQAWADRDPVGAYEYKRGIISDVHKRMPKNQDIGDQSHDISDSDMNELLFGVSAVLQSKSNAQDEEQEVRDIHATADFSAAIPRIGYAMGKFSPDTALQWALDSEYAVIDAVLYSIAWNHPDKLPDVTDKIFMYRKDSEISPEGKMELARIWLKNDPESANKWIQTFSQEAQAQLHESREYYKNLANMESAIHFWETLPGDDRNIAKNTIISLYKEKEPEKLLNWIQEKYVSDDITKLDLQVLCEDLVPQSKVSALKYKEYLEQLPSCVFKSEMSKHLFDASPATGYDLNDSLALVQMAMGKEIIDFEIVLKVIENRNWYYDLHQLSTWINALELPKKEKEKLIQKSTFSISK